jgi:hypothetical protein
VEVLRVLEHLIVVAIAAGILALGLHVSARDFEHVEFIAANTAIEEFFRAGFGVKDPASRVFDEWHGELGVLLAKLEDHSPFTGGNELVALAQSRSKRSHFVRGLHQIRICNLAESGAEDRAQLRLVVGGHSPRQGRHRFAWRGKALALRGGSEDVRGRPEAECRDESQAAQNVF